MTITALAALGGPAALTVACLAIPFAPVQLSISGRFAVASIAWAAYMLGPSSLIIAVPAALGISRLGASSSRAVIALVAIHFQSHQFGLLPQIDWLTIHPGSTAFIMLPAIAIALAFGPAIGWRAILALSCGVAASLILLNLSSERWIEASTLVDPVFRLVVALVPIPIASAFLQPKFERFERWRWLAIGAASGLAVACLLPVQPLTTMSFDEAHGEWETVQRPFGPEDFGRAANYTYSLLYRYAARVVRNVETVASENTALPEGGAFVLKMPTLRVSDAFADRLATWVRDGGRLLVVADHTDLYDTTQNLNSVLSTRFGIVVNADAVFNAVGMPTVPTTERFAALLGHIDAYGQPLPWQTGASLKSVPVNTVGIAAFGPSFSEPGDYSRQNRFGPFLPRATARFADHLAVAAFGVGRGAVVVILDSTPWSNFSIFMKPYRHVFRGVIHALERPAALQVWGWGALALAAAALIVPVVPHRFVFGISGLLLGLTTASAAQIGQSSFFGAEEGRDHGLRIVAGSAARLEFLKQLVGPGQRNYARIVSALAKYDLDPVASTPGSEVPLLYRAKRWLLIEPDDRQLPHSEDVIAHLKRGGDLAVVFAPDQAAETGVRQWLASLSLYAQKTAGLAVGEDAKVGFLSRKGAALLRDVRVITGASTTSILKDRESDVLIQSYTARPTVMPRTSGVLLISFSADQFSDDAVGEVWEGIHPSSLGRLRERQLAASLLGQEFAASFPDDLIAPGPTAPADFSLPAYALFSDGKTIISGRFDEQSEGVPSPSENVQAYLADLRTRAAAFIVSSCPTIGRNTICHKRLLGPDSVEWMVTWGSDAKGQPTTVELLHDRRFSGMGSTVNVVFGQ